MYLQLPLWHWGANNVYLFVFSSWKVNNCNPIANPAPTVATVTAEKTQPTHDLSLQCDEEFRPLPKTSTNKASRSVEEIEAEIKETQEELDAQENSASWADACDTDDIEEKLEELDTELKAAHTQLKGQKDTFGRPCADDSAW